MIEQRLRIGIITPTYERPELLQRLHLSLVGDRCTFDWRHYVVNDGSRSDYSAVVEHCIETSGRFQYAEIPNSGPLIARNTAIELAIADKCTHIVFIDDDDVALPGGIQAMVDRVSQHSQSVWFLFKSKKERPDPQPWPAEPTKMNWIDDIVLAKRLGSDNVVLIRTDALGQTRFSTRGRNQREWTFLLEMARKSDNILVCPETVKQVCYQADGLTALAGIGSPSLDQIWNGLERALRYWWTRPTDPTLIFKALLQVLLAPYRLIRTKF